MLLDTPLHIDLVWQRLLPLWSRLVGRLVLIGRPATLEHHLRPGIQATLRVVLFATAAVFVFLMKDDVVLEVDVNARFFVFHRATYCLLVCRDRVLTYGIDVFFSLGMALL